MDPPQLPQPIAYGRTAEVYPWKDGQILKLYYDWFSLQHIRNEQYIARAVYESGIPSPAVGEIVHVDGRNGLVYQRLHGRSMLEALPREPAKIPHYARRMAELHLAMHARTVEIDLPAVHDRLARKIDQARTLPEALRRKALTALESMPGGDRLCHNDFHPDNIIVSEQGETIIDWGDAALGNPLADLARTSIIIAGAVNSPQIPDPDHKAAFNEFHRLYLHHYLSMRPGVQAEYRRWLPIVAAARLSENIPEIEGWLIDQVRSRCDRT